MAGEEENVLDKKKAHRTRHAGRKAEKKKAKKNVQEVTDKQRNPKAFTFKSAVRAERRFRRTQDVKTKKQHIPLVDRTPLEPPPVVVAIVGPPKVGKTTLIQCLIRNFTRQPLSTIKGPVTLVTGKKRRITLIECNNDINSMIDIAKVADLILLLVDASFGFEMEIFEFLNICQVHGMPRVMGVLTHLDMLKHNKQLKRTKKTLKHRFWTEVYDGAKLFYLSGLLHGEYLRNEVKNLGRFISIMKFRPLTWRTSHSYILADRMEDLTPPEEVRRNSKVDRTVSLYGFVRGIPLNKYSNVHIPGCGDFKIHDVAFLPDPCPLPEKIKRRSLVEKERLIYAPLSGVGGIVYDKDAVYVELAGSHSHTQEGGRGMQLVNSMLEVQETLDEKMAHSELQLFSGAEPLKATDIIGKSPRYSEELVIDSSGRKRRKVVFTEEGDIDDADNEDSSDDSEVNESESDCQKKLPEKGAKTDDNNGVNIPKSGMKRNSLEGVHGPPAKKIKKTAVSVVNAKLMEAIGNSSSEEEEDDENEELQEESENDCDHPKTLQEEPKIRYHELSADKDKAIKSQITDVLTKLEDSVECECPTHSTIEGSTNVAEEMYDTDYSEMESEEEESLNELESGESSLTSEAGEEGESDNAAEESAMQWKANLAQRAADAFLERQATSHCLWKLVYGTANYPEDCDSQNHEKGGTKKEDEVGGLFHVVSRHQQQHQEDRDLRDAEDCSRFNNLPLHDWSSLEVRLLIRDCFVTGKWKESEDAAALLCLDDAGNEDDDNQELFGDFEDLETGEKHKASTELKKSIKGGDINNTQSAATCTKEHLIEKKHKLKEKFDNEYDDKEGDHSFYAELRQEVDHQAQLNKNEFEGMDDNLRVQLEGFRAGMYVRVEFTNVPCELVTHFDPTYPLIIGGLQTGEENVGYVQVRLKKHRWYNKILKSRDPLIVSLGWRRFQTLPIYAKLEDNLRHRMLKYTPEHVSCMAHFWGPITPQGTGFLAVQDVTCNQPGFRIVATGSVVELDKSVQVMKKLKLTGVPLKVYKKTAFIRGMFNSSLEVAKFEGAKLRTVSGIRGMIKKASGKPEGSFRATFEDKILLSDIVFCRTWYRVDIPHLYNPVTSLLLPMKEKNLWRGMKTVGQLKREKGIRSVPAEDSLYTPVERQPRTFRPLSIPRQLQRALPYKDKPKICVGDTAKERLEKQRVAVIREPHERKIAAMMKMLKTSYSHKQEQVKKAIEKKKEQRRKELQKEEIKMLRKQKEARKQLFRKLSKMEKTKNSKLGR